MKKLKPLLFSIFLNIFWIAAASANLMELKAKTELEEVLKKLLPTGTFILHTSATYETLVEKKLSENEVILQKSGNSDEGSLPPALPGFEITHKSSDPAAPSPEHNRMVYKYSEKEVLKKLQVQILYDETLNAELIHKMTVLVQSYLSTHFGALATLSVNPLPVEVIQEETAPDFTPWIAAAAALGIITLLLLFYFYRRRRNSDLSELESAHGPSPVETSLLASSEKTSDLRKELLGSILGQTQAFQAFYRSLPLEKRKKLNQYLQGPAFFTLLENLSLVNQEEIPPSSDAEETPQPEQILAYLRDFSEFVRIYAWQNNQFFGFLESTPLDKLALWAHEKNPLLLAVMTRFMQPGQISPFLESLSKAQKIAVLQNSEAASLLSMEEISKIESTARHELSQLPSVHYERKEVSFWSTVMSHTEDQDQFLADFHRTHPELYPILAQLRFKLEDIPTLEESLVQKVLGELNNDQLAKAFLRSSPELIAYVLGQLRENRRQLVSSQMTTLQRLPENQLKEAERDLAARFRKARV